MRESSLLPTKSAWMSYAENLIEPALWRNVSIIATIVCWGLSWFGIFGAWPTAYLAAMLSIVAQGMVIETAIRKG